MLSVTVPRQRWAVLSALLIVSFLFLAYSASSRSGWHPRTVVQHLEHQNVFNETLGFEKIFVVSLASRTDRRDSMSLAAYLTDLHIEYIDGVTEVEDRVLPQHEPDVKLSQAYLGSWRAHMNAIRRIIDQNISSALIMEDDADWDLRIRSQMQTFSQASRLLTLPRAGNTSFWDPTHPRSEGDQPVDLNLNLSSQTAQRSSPYGDWDVLWLGHCGTRFARVEDSVPLGRVPYLDDTVPEPQHIGIEFIGQGKELREYPPHTRVVYHGTENACSAAYAVSLSGAKRILYELSTRLTSVYDIMLGEVCEGKNGRRAAACLTVQPGLFNQHRFAGSTGTSSDISDHNGGFRKTAFSRNIRWSTRVNMRKLVQSETDYIDSFPDGTDATDVGF